MIPLSREQWFKIAWRAALLALPLQTRFLLSTPLLNGFPWEQATLAIYASWIPLIITVVLSWDALKARAAKASLRAMVAIPLIILAIASVTTSSGIATLVWWIHAILLGLFVAALHVRQVPALTAASWMVFSLIPHAILALIQAGVQRVWGSTILGIAQQISWDSGVSVVEYGEYRVLRSYGGFPHPNLLGGWLAVALLFIPELIRQAKNLVLKCTWMISGGLFLFALVLTFSRGAWLAAAAGFTLAAIFAFRKAETTFQREAFIPAAILFVSILALALITQWDTVTTRFRPMERLERWSIVQRVDAIHDGFTAFKLHPVLGWGPGASLIGTAVARTTASPVPLEPPHMVPFVILMETGILGLAAVLAFFAFLFRPLLKNKRWLVAAPLLATFALLALTDHYLWTLWAGQSLAALLLFFLLAARKGNDQQN